MKIKVIACLSVLTLVGIIGLKKQTELKHNSEIALANINALCDDREWSIDIEYDKGCLDQYGDGCCLSPTDWRPNLLAYNY